MIIKWNKMKQCCKRKKLNCKFRVYFQFYSREHKNRIMILLNLLRMRKRFKCLWSRTIPNITHLTYFIIINDINEEKKLLKTNRNLPPTNPPSFSLSHFTLPCHAMNAFRYLYFVFNIEIFLLFLSFSLTFYFCVIFSYI